VRDAVGFDTGNRISFRVRKDGVVEMRPDDVDLLSLCGMLKPRVKGVTLEEMDEAVRLGATGE
jgi:hypothetical protein